MKITSKISAVIVTHNNSDIIRNALCGLDRHAPTVGLTVVDNNSSDGTGGIIENEFPDVGLIKLEKNIGFGAAHNRVLPMLESQYHVIINPDIELRDDVILRMASYMDENADVALLSPRVLNLDGSEQILPKRAPYLRALISRRLFKNNYGYYEMADKDLSRPQEIGFATGCFMFIKTDLFKKIGGFDERYFLYFEDADLTRTAEKHGKVLYHPEFEVYHAWQRDNAKKLKFMRIQVSSMIKYFCKWGIRV
ncbi:MAG: glycosyltransferase family 2 protein [Oscillospiraceae bacterium]|nr:glycosyltransferase family 2 protein [Oscillospiraceae bacterium]